MTGMASVAAARAVQAAVSGVNVAGAKQVWQHFHPKRLFLNL